MKQFRITFTEENWNLFQNLIGELPTKFGVPMLNMINPNLQESVLEPIKKDRPVEMPIQNVYEDENGGSPKPPKPPRPSEE